MPAWLDSRCGGTRLVALALLQLSACEAESRAGGDLPSAEGPQHDAGENTLQDGAALPREDAAPASTPDGAGADPQVVRDAAGSVSATSGDAGAARAFVPTLFFLDVTGERVLRADPAGRSSQPIVTRGSAAPDGIAVDPLAGVLYWTNMGVPAADDGYISRADLNGTNVASVVPKAATFTPKQLCLDAEHGLLYWSDREGMRVMRARVDGSNVETLVVTGSGASARADASNWAVGIALDPAAGHVYWTQKGPDNGHTGSIRRAPLALSPGADPARRKDIEVLFAGLPEPVDLALDLEHRRLYWTDRGDNTISRATLDPPPGVAPNERTDRAILVRDAGEAIGVTLDVAHDLMYYTALEGTVSKAKLDGSGATAILRNQGSLTGIAYVELPLR